MAFDYNRIVYDVVIPQIKDKGTLVTLTRIENASTTWEHKIDHVENVEYWENTNTGVVVFVKPANTSATWERMALITDYTEEELRNTSIRTGDKKLLSIELPVPKQGDVYTVKGVDYQYVNHITIAPGDVDVLYKIQVRY